MYLDVHAVSFVIFLYSGTNFKGGKTQGVKSLFSFGLLIYDKGAKEGKAFIEHGRLTSDRHPFALYVAVED